MYNYEEYVNYPVVWLTENRAFAWLIQEGAHFATVVYYDHELNIVEDQIENDEYITWEEKAVHYE